MEREIIPSLEREKVANYNKGGTRDVEIVMQEDNVGVHG